MQKYFYWTIAYIFILLSSVLFADGMPINDANTKYLKSLKQITNKTLKKYGGTVLGKKIPTESPKKDFINYLIYFYSESMPFKTIKNMIPQFIKYKTIKPNTQIFVVFNGFPKKEFYKMLRKEYKKELHGLFKIKIHPPMYKYFNLNRIPAYSLMKCPKDFRFKQCDRNNSLLVRGDISIVDLFQILSDYNKKYKTIYEKLIEVK